MKKSLFLAGLAVLTFSVSGMNFPNPNDQENLGNNRRNFQQVNGINGNGLIFPLINGINGNGMMTGIPVTDNPNNQMRNVQQVNGRNGNGARMRAPANGNPNNQMRNVQQVNGRNGNGARMRVPATGNPISQMRILQLITGARADIPNNVQRMRLNTILDVLSRISPNNNLNAGVNNAWFDLVRSNNLDGMKIFPLRFVHLQNQRGNTALHIAASNGNLDMVRWILSYYTESSGIVRFLSANKNRIKLRDKDIETLYNQSFSDRLGLANKANNEETTPLFLAAQNGHLGVVQYLTEHGADVNKASNKGKTPLYVAAENGHLDIVKYLVEHGADVNKATNNGETPLSIETRNGHQNVVQYLTEHEANRKGKRRAEGAEDIQYDISAKKAKRDN